MTLRALKHRIRLFRLDFKIHRSAVIHRRGDVTHRASRDRDALGFRIECVHRRNAVTGIAAQICMARKLMAKFSG